jgi:hypothetical protein
VYGPLLLNVYVYGPLLLNVYVYGLLLLNVYVNGPLLLNVYVHGPLLLNVYVHDPLLYVCSAPSHHPIPPSHSSAGPNHVLPTGGTARFSGGLSVFSFLRVYGLETAPLPEFRLVSESKEPPPT